MARWTEPHLVAGARPSKLVALDGGLCMTFVNTASRKRKGVKNYAGLVAWGRQHGTLGIDDAERLTRVAELEQPDRAKAVLKQALELRASLVRIFDAISHSRAGAPKDLEVLNAAVRSVLSKRSVKVGNVTYVWEWDRRDDDDFDRMLWPVVLSAVDVLTSKRCRKIRRCAGEDCDLLFVQRGPGSPRKWCDDNDCGTRARSRKHYQRVLKPERAERKRKVEERLRARWQKS